MNSLDYNAREKCSMRRREGDTMNRCISSSSLRRMMVGTCICVRDFRGLLKEKGMSMLLKSLLHHA